MTNLFDLIDIEKALTTDPSTTGNILIPKIVEPGIKAMFEQRSPLWNILPKERMEGYAISWREQNGLPVASWGAEMAALPAAQNATYVEKTNTVKTIYIRGEISGQLQAATRTVENVLRREIGNRTLGLIRTLEGDVLNGDDVANPNKIKGLARWITNEVDARGANPANGAPDVPLSFNLIEVLLDTPVGGRPSHLLVGEAMSRKLHSVILPSVRYMDTTSIRAGMDVPSYNGIPIIVFKEHGAILNNTIVAPDMSMVRVPILTDITYEELAKTRDSVDYFIKMYLTLIVEGVARHHAKLTHVSSVIS